MIEFERSPGLQAVYLLMAVIGTLVMVAAASGTRGTQLVGLGTAGTRILAFACLAVLVPTALSRIVLLLRPEPSAIVDQAGVRTRALLHQRSVTWDDVAYVSVRRKAESGAKPTPSDFVVEVGTRNGDSWELLDRPKSATWSEAVRVLEQMTTEHDVPFIR